MQWKRQTVVRDVRALLVCRQFPGPYTTLPPIAAAAQLDLKRDQRTAPAGDVRHWTMRVRLTAVNRALDLHFYTFDFDKEQLALLRHFVPGTAVHS